MKPLGRVSCENVLTGMSERMRSAMLVARWEPQRAARIERTLLLDVVLNGVNALRVRKNGRKR